MGVSGFVWPNVLMDELTSGRNAIRDSESNDSEYVFYVVVLFVLTIIGVFQIVSVVKPINAVDLYCCVVIITLLCRTN